MLENCGRNCHLWIELNPDHLWVDENDFLIPDEESSTAAANRGISSLAINGSATDRSGVRRSKNSTAVISVIYETALFLLFLSL